VWPIKAKCEKKKERKKKEKRKRKKENIGEKERRSWREGFRMIA